MGETTCERCGRPRCSVVPHWLSDARTKECSGGEDCYRIGYERSQAALAAARRELSFLATAAGRLAVLLDGVVDWDAQGEDDGIAINAVGAVARRVGVVTPEEFRRWDYSAALAAPAAGEEGA